MKYYHTELFYTNPLALFINVKVSPSNQEKWFELPAKIDTGADFSILPLFLFDEYKNILPNSYCSICTATDNEEDGGKDYPSYFFNVLVENQKIFRIETVFLEYKKYMLIGRDILNEITLNINGSNKYFEIIL